MKNPLGYITDEITNLKVTDKFNCFAKLKDIREGLKTPSGIAFLLNGIEYSEYNEKLFLELNNSRFNVGLNKNGYYIVRIPENEKWVFVNTPYGVFHAKQKESRWKLV